MKSEHRKLYEASGEVTSTSRLVSFLYALMRDEVSVGVVQEILEHQVICTDTNGTPLEEFTFTNGWLANYAIYVADRLLENEAESVCIKAIIKEHNLSNVEIEK